MYLFDVLMQACNWIYKYNIYMRLQNRAVCHIYCNFKFHYFILKKFLINMFMTLMLILMFASMVVFIITESNSNIKCVLSAMKTPTSELHKHMESKCSRCIWKIYTENNMRLIYTGPCCGKMVISGKYDTHVLYM